MKAMTKFIALAALVFASVAQAELGKEYDIRPDQNVQNGPSAVDWQWKENAKIAAETAPAKLAEVVATPEAAAQLLAKVKTAYATDAMVATKIAAVTQYVMGLQYEAPWYAFWDDGVAPQRKLWVTALLDAAEQSSDLYCKMFYLEQLRYCATKGDVCRLKAIGEKTEWKAVKEFIPVVIGK